MVPRLANVQAAKAFVHSRGFFVYSGRHMGHTCLCPLSPPSSRLPVNLSVCPLVLTSYLSPPFILLPKYRFSDVKRPFLSPIFHELLTLKSLF